MLNSRLSSLQISFIFHGTVIFVFVLAGRNFFQSSSAKTTVKFEVYQQPKVVSQQQLTLQNSQPKPKEQSPEKQEPRKVFGLSRKAITSTQVSSSQTVEVKAGNTVAKEMDQLKLNSNDVDSLPIPSDDYLITRQVSLIKDVKVPYPEEAKKNKIEGPVVMDLLIDQSGKVRSVELVRGPGYGLNEAAIQAVKSFEFRPAQVKEQAVAVKIRYTYRFVLEID